MADYGELIDNIKYADSELPQYLLYDNWDIKEGLLLLADLSPKDHDVRYTNRVFADQSMKNEYIREFWYQPDKIVSFFARPLTADSSFTLIHKEFFENFINPEEVASSLSSKLGINLSKEQLLDTIDILNKTEKHYKRKFIEIQSIWYSGDHWDRGEDYVYPVKDFIKWAEDKNIDVPWFDWAKKEGLLKYKSIKQETIHPRAEKTYLTIIGALLEFIAGKSPGGGNKHPDFESEAILIDKFREYEMPGLSKSTLENKFADAKKSYNSIF